MIKEALIKFSRSRGDLLEVKIKDLTRRIIYKDRCNISDKKRIALIFGSLKKFGIEPEEVLKQILKNEEALDEAMT